MSIPIPIILALIAQKNSSAFQHNPPSSSQSSSLVPVNSVQSTQKSRVQKNKEIAAKLNGVAQIVGGTRGAKLGNAANIINSVNRINSPINALSLIAKSRMNSPINNILSNSSANNIKGASNIYDNINKMISGMDKDKKDELMSMANSIMNPDN